MRMIQALRLAIHPADQARKHFPAERDCETVMSFVRHSRRGRFLLRQERRSPRIKAFGANWRFSMWNTGLTFQRARSVKKCVAGRGSALRPLHAPAQYRRAHLGDCSMEVLR